MKSLDFDEEGNDEYRSKLQSLKLSKIDTVDTEDNSATILFS